MPDRVAGYLFIDTPRGEACECGRTWLEVLEQRELWRPGQSGIAHSGALNETEVKELNAKLQRIWDAGMRF